MCRRDVLAAAFDAVAENGGAPGVDGERLETIAATAQSQEQWLEALREELRTKRYRPSPVRRVWLAKRSGGERPLGIPTVKDRVVQSAVYLALMPIYEADPFDFAQGRFFTISLMGSGRSAGRSRRWRRSAPQSRRAGWKCSMRTCRSSSTRSRIGSYSGKWPGE